MTGYLQDFMHIAFLVASFEFFAMLSIVQSLNNEQHGKKLYMDKMETRTAMRLGFELNFLTVARICG